MLELKKIETDHAAEERQGSPPVTVRGRGSRRARERGTWVPPGPRGRENAGGLTRPLRRREVPSVGQHRALRSLEALPASSRTSAVRYSAVGGWRKDR